ncbi:MAG: glycosyl transferase [Rhodobacteraceae bacterium]|nr:glycosyl transferase [Paracoccaceae bacterium]MBT26149.1 glycosyl transferase [Paracoccaceae bacterium]
MFDFGSQGILTDSVGAQLRLPASVRWTVFGALKRVFDILMSLFLMPVLIGLMVVLLVLNPFFNKGSLFFVQSRMGRNCRAFRAIKFRTMIEAQVTRGPNDPLERDRITRLGGFLRRTRLDEVPQILNVLLGDMSLIGPRPDYYDHAVTYLETVQGYRERHLVRPGISGLAQTEVGYVEGIEATQRKVQADLFYITHTGFALEAWIFWRTLMTVFGRAGA